MEKIGTAIFFLGVSIVALSLLLFPISILTLDISIFSGINISLGSLWIGIVFMIIGAYLSENV